MTEPNTNHADAPTPNADQAANPTQPKPRIQEEQFPALAKALINLRGESLGTINQATGIRAANLSVWLRGKEQVISAKRAALLLHHLGVEGGRLRQGVLHDWESGGALEDLQLVARLTVDPDELVLLADRSTEFERTCFLVGQGVLIRLKTRKGVSTAPQVQEVVPVKAVGVFDTPLGVAPKHWNLKDLNGFLWELCKARLEDPGLDYSRESGRASEATLRFLESALNPANGLVVQGWAELEAALRDALSKGVTPHELAQLLPKSPPAKN